MLSFDSAAKQLNISTKSLRRAYKRGDIKAVRLGRRVVIPDSELNRVMSDGFTAPRQSEAAAHAELRRLLTA